MGRVVAFQGVCGAYSDLAAKKYFQGNIKTRPYRHFHEVFKAVVKGTAQAGIIPIENSLAGSIHENYDLLLKHNVWISGEIKMRVSHNLIANRGVRANEILQIYSHPQALAQCQGFLSELKTAEPIPYFDTAGSVKLVKDCADKTVAAIGSREAAQVYGLRIVKKAIEDNPENFTRFFIIHRKRKLPKKKCKM